MWREKEQGQNYTNCQEQLQPAPEAQWAETHKPVLHPASLTQDLLASPPWPQCPSSTKPSSNAAGGARGSDYMKVLLARWISFYPFVFQVARALGRGRCGFKSNSQGRVWSGRCLPGSYVLGRWPPFWGCTSGFGDRAATESSRALSAACAVLHCHGPSP